MCILLHMLTERLQILVEPRQRRRLRAEARRRGTSVGTLVREAIDAHLGGGSREERLRAVEEMRAAPPGPFVTPDELDRLAEAEHDEGLRIPEARKQE
jgi:hypothetical protein